MPPVPSGGSSRRKQGQPTVCLDCYLRKVKCDRKRPCGTCIRRGTEHLCKTFETSQLSEDALKKKQARRSIAEITALAQASAPSVQRNVEGNVSSDQDQRGLASPSANSGSDAGSTAGGARNEAPLTSFINLLLQDLSVGDDEFSSGGGSPGSLSGIASGSTPPPPSAVRYTERKTLDIVLSFCAAVPDLPRLSRLVSLYLVEVDWKFMLTAQDYFEDYVRDLWQRVVMPCQEHNRLGRSSVPLESCFRPGDLSKLAMMASFLSETIGCIDPQLIPELFPASSAAIGLESLRLPVTAQIDKDAAPRVRGLSLLIHHLQSLIEECERLEEMTIDLVQSNLTAFTIWADQGMFGLSDFPHWETTIKAARESKLFEDPERLGITDPLLLDHRRRLGWLVYGYDHSFAVGANVKPLILESQFSVDRPSTAPPWIASGVPADPTLAMCEVEVAEIAKQLAVCSGSDGPPLHRKIMEVDQQILAFINKLDPTYALDQPDLSMDQRDPWRARRRPWLGLNLCWQRSLLHRNFFFPNGRINNGELATSRHIAIDSSLRALDRIREVRRVQNRFSDWQGSAWYFQYLTEPSITLATATLLLLRSRGRGIPGLADEATCWPTVFHFCKILDQSITVIDQSMKDATVCLPSFLAFAKRCSQMLVQLRATIQTGVDALLTKSNGASVDAVGLQVDDKLAGLLNPRARTRTPSHDSTARGSISSSAGSNNASPRHSVSTAGNGHAGSASGRSSLQTTSQSQVHVPVAAPAIPHQQLAPSSQVLGTSAQPQVPPTWQASGVPGSVLAPMNVDESRDASMYGSGGAGGGGSSSRSTGSGPGSATMSPPFAQGDVWMPSSNISPTVSQQQQQLHQQPQDPRQRLQSMQFGGAPAQTQPVTGASMFSPQTMSSVPALSTTSYDPVTNTWSSAPAVPAPHLSNAVTVGMLTPLDVSQALNGSDVGQYDVLLSPTNTISSMEPGALRSYYTDDRVQRAAHENRGLSEWIASVQSGIMLPPPPPPSSN